MPRLADDHQPVRGLKEWRMRLAKSQAELAQELGVNLSTLRTWEQRVNRPRPATLRKIAAYFHVEPWQIDFDKPGSVPGPKAEAVA